MSYYWAEHESAYRRIAQEGMNQWNDLYQEARPGDFANRAFLERVLPRLGLSGGADALEYGCGTGLTACFLAAQGFSVDAFDLIPQAISLAERHARDRGVHVNFSVHDVCALANEPVVKQYDLIVDSYCLQSIVLDEDRASLLGAVHARLKSVGYYVLSTAMFDPERVYEDEFRYDEPTGICYELAASYSEDGAIEIDGSSYRPHRRHLKPPALHQELTQSGFRVISQEGQQGGDIVCARDADA